MALRDVLAGAGVVDLQRALTSDKRYLAFTSFAADKGTLMLSVTDGTCVWSTELDEDSLQQHREVAGFTTLDPLLSGLRSSFMEGSLQLFISAEQATLTTGDGTEFELYEATAARSRQNVTDILFRLATKAIGLEQELGVTKTKLADLRKQSEATVAAASSAMFLSEPEFKKAKNPLPKVKKQQGRSLINPSSRRRKTASGVVFDES